MPIGCIYIFIMKLIGIMKNQFRDLKLHQMDDLLAHWASVRLSPCPKSGWVKSIREALGMSATALARRLGMTHAGVRKLELAEATDVITIASLRKLAAALDCELHYALVPRTNLTQQIKERVAAMVSERMYPMQHTMALEDQAVQSSINKLQFDLLANQLIEGSRRDLW